MLGIEEHNWRKIKKTNFRSPAYRKHNHNEYVPGGIFSPLVWDCGQACMTERGTWIEKVYNYQFQGVSLAYLQGQTNLKVQ